MSKIVYGPWVEQSKKVDLPLDQFGEVAQAFLYPINQAQKELQAAYAPFEKGGNIRPVHCKTVMNSLDRTSRHIQEFCTFLREAPGLPVIIAALRYHLLALLRYAEEQSLQLLDLIDEHRQSCLTPSQQVLQQRREISIVFETLLQHLAAISQLLLFLNDEAQFQERRLILMLEEHAYSVVILSSWTEPISTGILPLKGASHEQIQSLWVRTENQDCLRSAQRREIISPNLPKVWS